MAPGDFVRTRKLIIDLLRQMRGGRRRRGVGDGRRGARRHEPQRRGLHGGLGHGNRGTAHAAGAAEPSGGDAHADRAAGGRPRTRRAGAARDRAIPSRQRRPADRGRGTATGRRNTTGAGGAGRGGSLSGLGRGRRARPRGGRRDDGRRRRTRRDPVRGGRRFGVRLREDVRTASRRRHGRPPSAERCLVPDRRGAGHVRVAGRRNQGHALRRAGRGRPGRRRRAAGGAASGLDGPGPVLRLVLVDDGHVPACPSST